MGRIRRVLEAIAEVFARSWPLSRTQDQVLDDLRSVYADTDERPGASAT